MSLGVCGGDGLALFLGSTPCLAPGILVFRDCHVTQGQLLSVPLERALKGEAGGLPGCSAAGRLTRLCPAWDHTPRTHTLHVHNRALWLFFPYYPISSKTVLSKINFA